MPKFNDIPLLLSPPPTINQFSPTVTPACPALGVGMSPCCVGLDHSIYAVKYMKDVIDGFIKEEEQKIKTATTKHLKRVAILQLANQAHANHWNKLHENPHQI